MTKKDSDQDQNHNKHQKLTDQIADGKAIDWENHESTSDIDALQKIRAVEKIFQAFTQSIVAEPATINTIAALFEWGHLQVIEKVGEGSFGEVFKAYDPILNREVALKLSHSELISAAGSRGFLEEARRLARVRHPNVIAVHGAAFEGDQVGIWTDLIAGQNLKEYFLEKGVLDLTSAYDLIRDMTQALNAVHQADLIHGDIKSTNVMRQNNGVFKLMDFGAGSESLEFDLMPHTGTPLLMAPELFEDKPITAASDQYALGAMLYQILTGKYPLTATNSIEIKQLHQNLKITNIQKLRPNLPKQLCELIHSLLSKDPLKRPTATETLERIMWIKNAPKRRKKFWAITAIITSLSIGVVISTWGYINAVRSENKAVLSEQESTAVSGFLADIIKSARPGVSGKNTPIIEVLEMAERRLETSLFKQPLAKAEILHHIGKSYHLIAAYDAAYKTLKQAHDLRLQHLGKNHIDTLMTQASLGRTLSFLNRFDEAKKLLFIDDHQIKSLPLKNNERLNFIYAQSTYHSLRGDYAVSAAMIKDIVSSVDKDQYPDYFYKMLLQFGSMVLNLKKFKEAEVVLKEVLVWAENNPLQKAMLLRTRSNMVRLYGQTKRFNQAEEYARLNIQEATEWLGPEDEFVIVDMSLLSNVLNAQGRVEESEQVNLEALNLAKKVLGQEYWLTLRLMGNQANRLESLNRLDEAIIQNLKTVEIAEKAFPTHNYSFLPWKNLATLYHKTEDYKKAAEFAQKAIPHMVERRGEMHKLTLELRFINNASLFYLGQSTLAVGELRILLSETKQALGKEHRLVEDIESVLAEATTIK